jgi:hypothetical protein
MEGERRGDGGRIEAKRTGSLIFVYAHLDWPLNFEFGGRIEG